MIKRESDLQEALKAFIITAKKRANCNRIIDEAFLKLDEFYMKARRPIYQPGEDNSKGKIKYHRFTWKDHQDNIHFLNNFNDAIKDSRQYDKRYIDLRFEILDGVDDEDELVDLIRLICRYIKRNKDEESETNFTLHRAKFISAYGKKEYKKSIDFIESIN